MTIYGTNDFKSLEERDFIPCQIKVWKGGRKRSGEDHKIFGKDLETYLRLELPQDEFIKNILKASYETNEIGGDLLVESLNIVLYCDDIEKTFFSSLALFKKNKPIHFCDKKTIHTQFKGRRGRPVKVSEKCHAPDIYSDCPLKCSEMGTLYFEILELRLAEATRFCSLNVSGINDVIGVAKAVNSIYQEFGALRNSPFWCSTTKRFIVCRLSRFPKKNSYEKTNYPLLLEVHPQWLYQLNLMRQKQELERLQQPLPVQLLADIYGEEMFDGETISVQSTPLLNPWKPSNSEIQELRSLYRENNWSSEELLNLLRDRFNVADFDAIKSFSKEQFEQLKSALKKW